MRLWLWNLETDEVTPASRVRGDRAPAGFQFVLARNLMEAEEQRDEAKRLARGEVL